MLQAIAQEIFDQGFIEIGLNVFFETKLPPESLTERALSFNVLAALVMYIFLRNLYKGASVKDKTVKLRIKELAAVLLGFGVLFIMKFGGLSTKYIPNVTFVCVFLFLTYFFSKIFTCCEVYIMADMHARFLQLYLQSYNADTSLLRISNILVVSHSLNVLFYLFLHTMKPSKIHGLSAFVISVALVLGINGFNIIVLLKELFSEKDSFSAILLWISILALGIPIISWLQKKGKVRNIIIRKFFHFQTVIMFSFGIIYTPLLMKVAFSVVIFLFTSLEALRITLRDHYPFILKYEAFVKTFIDERDNDRLIYTHIFLLLGCAYPFLLEWRGTKDTELKHLLTKFAGILILGVGDSMAAIIGSKYGKYKRYINPKSYEGLLAGIVSMMIYIAAIILLYFPQEFGDFGKLLKILAATTFIGIMEALTRQNDNLVLPVTYYNMLLAFL